jgi:hypothetical protein
MRRLIALTVLLFAFAACKKKPETVDSILKHYQEINKKLKDYKVKHVDDLTSPAPGSITGYYREDEVKKIVGEHYTDTCRTFVEYYFDDGMLIYVVKQNFVYNVPDTLTEEKARARGDSVWYDDKKTRLEVSRYYFSDNKLFRWVGPDGKGIPRKDWGPYTEATLWAQTIVLIKELKEQ